MLTALVLLIPCLLVVGLVLWEVASTTTSWRGLKFTLPMLAVLFVIAAAVFAWGKSMGLSGGSAAVGTSIMFCIVVVSLWAYVALGRDVRGFLANERETSEREAFLPERMGSMNREEASDAGRPAKPRKRLRIRGDGGVRAFNPFGMIRWKERK